MVSFYMLVCMGVGRIFSRGALLGGQSGEIWFLPLETGKQPVLLRFSNSRHPYLCGGKCLCHTIKKWSNFNRFNTIPNKESLLNLIRKRNIRQINFNCFCIGNTKQPYLFLHWQHNWHPYRQLSSCYICFVLTLHSGI